MENRLFYSGVAAEVALHHVLAPSIKPLCVSSFEEYRSTCQHMWACLNLGYTRQMAILTGRMMTIQSICGD